MDRGPIEAAEVLGSGITTEATVRRASHIEVDDETLAFIEGRLDEVRDTAARFFGVPLTGREGTSVLRYTAGGFFRQHRDRGDVPSWPAAARRRLAVVIFLTTSKESDPSGTFGGGILRLLPDDEADTSIDLHARAGTLVVFPATRLHEVTLVREGVRDAIVDWFF